MHIFGRSLRGTRTRTAVTSIATPHALSPVLWSSSWTRGSLRYIHLRHKKKLIFSTCHSFPFLFRQPWTWLFMSSSVGVSRKAEDTNPTGERGPCFQFLVKSELLICFCCSVCMIFLSFPQRDSNLYRCDIYGNTTCTKCSRRCCHRCHSGK